MYINYFPISFEFDTYQIGFEKFTIERLAELRSLYNDSHSFFRHDDFIYISKAKSIEVDPIGSITTRSVFDDIEVTSSLVKHLFFRSFKDRFPGYVPVDFYPFRFFSEQDKDDIIQSALPAELKNVIGYKKLIELQLRVTEINGIKRLGFLINIRRNWIFKKSCRELSAEGYNLLGTEVLRAEILPGLGGILGPSEDLIGQIAQIEGDKAIVETNNGREEYPLGTLFLKKSSFNIYNYLSFKCGSAKSEEIQYIIESKKEEVLNFKNQHENIKSIAKHLFASSGLPILFKNEDGFCFYIEKDLMSVTSSISLQSPTFIFDHASTQTDRRNADLGLTSFGPYDSITFDCKNPKILCICSRDNRGYFANFLSNLRDGLPQSKYFKKGLLKKYDLLNINYEVKEINNIDTKDYLNVISEYDESRPDLAIIEIPSSMKMRLDAGNPYYLIKAKLLSLEIPVQFVTSEKVRKHDEYILNSLALQVYAKLGGTPWVLPSQRSVDREMVVGIGHSIYRANRFVGGYQSKIVGITTFLSSDGQYLLGEKVRDVPYEKYFDELLRSLRQSIERLSMEQGWAPGETVRLIFHIFKPIKNIEFDVVASLIQGISEYKIQFAFVTISKFHPHLMFDLNQNGIARAEEIKGQLVPARGTNLILDKETCIVQMFGPEQLKTAKQGVSGPIQIRIVSPRGKHYNQELAKLMFYDLSYLTQQIFSFTYLSWRTFLPGERPATMMYSELIARLLGKLRQVDGWDPDKLNYGLKRKKWFL